MRDKRRIRQVKFAVESIEERALTSSLTLAQLYQQLPSAAAQKRASDDSFASALFDGRSNAVEKATGMKTPLDQRSPIPGIEDVKHGPLAKAGQELIKLYQEFFDATERASNEKDGVVQDKRSLMQIVGDSVRVDIRGTGGAAALARTLGKLGMQVQSTNALTGTVEGLLPISQLENVAKLSQVISISAVHVPKPR